MSLLIGFMTVILVLNCLLLILLILIQLPKKEAGAGIAFGGGATDALFGAGSGTALTKLTKYCAGLFLGLSLILSVVNAQRVGRSNASLAEELKKKAAAARSATLVATNTPAATTSAAPFTIMQNTNAATATNPAPAPGK